ncbi:MAG TPA: peptide-methionine (S)-S-oxide reductase MsrA [Cellvibrio sp.]|nr:peptide-methionine (S)-S-oxide reductase MsrA [Cellvibrio sp.]
MTVQKIVLGGGCFWCIESVFNDIMGVKSVISGYAGGHDENPTYEKICTGRTGHAEVIEISYDPAIIDLTGLLKVFFTIHDPTTLNRQGNDIGTQYRSAIFYKNDQERRAFEEFIAELKKQKIFHNEIVTQLEELKTFFPAEEYHQDYFRKNPDNSYCQYSIPPKRQKILEHFPGLLK